jgi:hypothetical protein
MIGERDHRLVTAHLRRLTPMRPAAAYPHEGKLGGCGKTRHAHAFYRALGFDAVAEGFKLYFESQL